LGPLPSASTARTTSFGQLTERLRLTRTDLKRARTQLGTAGDRASERLVQLYLNGSEPSTLEVMLGSKSLSEMLDQIGMLENSKDVDTDLAQMMITHHEGAITMAKLAEDKADHDELKDLAEAIISAQEREIDVMRPHASGSMDHG
jgi:uncharacterized protein (DUF305 family)